VTPTHIDIDQVQFVKELYPRLREDDAAIERPHVYFCITDDPTRSWTVRPDDQHGGWIGRMVDFQTHEWSETGWGFKPEAVLRCFRMWGLPDPVTWQVEQQVARNPEMVYIIGSPATSLVKIGRSDDVPRRLREIQHMSPVPLSVIWQTPGGAALEARLHRTFAALRCHGEWFDFGGNDPIMTVRKEISK
jgi:hypothetical protein